MENNSNIENSSNPTPNEPSKKFFLGAWDFLKIVIIAALIVAPIRYFVFRPFIVKGQSMVPTFHNSDYLIIDELSYKFSEPQRGDVIVLKFPPDPDQKFIKRIIGLPGETLQIKDGQVKAIKGGQEIILEENYLSGLFITKGELTVTLEENEYYVLGDNRNFSYDSRGWGPLPKENIVGRAVLRLFPFEDITFISSPDY